jgi:hypothetical protein
MQRNNHIIRFAFTSNKEDIALLVGFFEAIHHKLTIGML